MKFSTILLSRLSPKALLLVVVLILLNVASHIFSVRLDLTKDHRYTLSEGTKEVLKSLEEPLMVKAYLSENLNAEFENHRKEVINLLEEYRELANGNIEIEIINPSEDEKKGQEAQNAGIPPFQTGSQGRDKLELQVAYFGLSFEYGTATDVIQVLQPGQPIEYPITKSIKKIAFVNKPKVGLLQGHGEPKLSTLTQAKEEALINYQFEEVKIDDANKDPLQSYAALVILNPSDSINPMEIKAIDDYYEAGGKLFVAYSKAQFSQGGQGGPPMIIARSSPFETWLGQKGFTFEEALIIDANAGEIMVPQGPFQIPVRFHYFPISEKFAKHPITNDLNGMIFQFITPMSYNGTGNYTPLVFTSEMSGKEAMPVMINIDKRWTESEFKEANMPMAGALVDGNKRMVIVANGEFMINGEGQQQQQVTPDNINFFVNSLDWLAENTSLVELRNKGFVSVPIKKLDDSEKRFYQYFNFLFPLFLILLYRIFRYQSNRRKRLKWKEMSL